MSIVPEINSTRRKIVVVDDFLKNPDELREFALSQTYGRRGSAGVRTEPFSFEIYRSCFSDLLDEKVEMGDPSSQPCNGCFQWCNAETPKVIHADQQTWAGALYLTPDAPPEAGTIMYRSREANAANRFNGGFFDETKWEVVDNIGNVYNRLVLWSGREVHSAAVYFGQTMEDSRLFQVFFFNSSS